MEEKEKERWIIVGNGSPYTYVGKTTLTSRELTTEMDKRECLFLSEARQIQTIVVPTADPKDPQKQVVGQENLVGPICLCAGAATIMITPQMIIEPDERTVAIIEEKIGMAHRADIHDRAKRAGLDTNVDNVRSIINRDGLRGKA